MDVFSDSLARLKHLLRVSKDGEVAAALGFSKTAFSERKKRRSFPTEELRALAKSHPELGIDVDYVLTGQYGRADAQAAPADHWRPLVDVELLAEAVAAVERLLMQRKRVIAPEKKAELIAQLYQALASGEDSAAVTQALSKVG